MSSTVVRRGAESESSSPCTMKRRAFLSSVVPASLGVAGGLGFAAPPSGTGSPGSGRDRIDKLAGLTLQQTREKYRSDLFDHYLPNLEEHVFDHDRGGFLCATDIRSGERIRDEKRAWYDGRGVWVYSFLYNRIDPDPRYLEYARKTIDFVLGFRPEGRRFWPAAYDSEGRPFSDREGDIYGNLFIAEGLAEYAKASGERRYYELSKELILDAFSRYEEPDYAFRRDDLGIPDTRVIGHWMIFLRLITQMLEHEADRDLERIADRCLDAILNRHYHPDFALHNEYLRHDFSLPDNEYADYSGTGHSIETFWMVMHEAVRRRDETLFAEAVKGFRRHMNVAYDAVYRGYFHELLHVDDYVWNVEKVLWLQDEVLVGALMLAEHTGDRWALDVYDETETWIREKFLKPGYKFWIHAGDRTVSNYPGNRVENYHIPRRLMLNLLAVERLIARDGRASGFGINTTREAGL